MILLKRFILMVQFLTTIPLPVSISTNQEDFGKGLVFAPLVGLAIGGILTGSYHVLNLIFSSEITTAFVLVIYIILTGGLHLDGLGDTFDGLFSNRSKDRMLEIMRDSRVGTNAVLAIGSVILLDWTLLTGIRREYISMTLALMPAAGRIGSLIGAGVSEYARKGEGLGKSFIEYCGIKEIFMGLAVYFLLFYCVCGVKWLLIAIITAATAFLLIKFFSRKIGGATGDILGAVCELNQTFFLVAVNVLQMIGK